MVLCLIPSTAPSFRFVKYDSHPEGIEAAVRNYKLIFGNTTPIVLTGVMRDKDHNVMTECLSEIALEVHTVTPDNPRAMPAEELAEEYAEIGVVSYSYEELKVGVKIALKRAKDKKVPLLVLGSLYMYGDVMDAMETIIND